MIIKQPIGIGVVSYKKYLNAFKFEECNHFDKPIF